MFGIFMNARRRSAKIGYRINLIYDIIFKALVMAFYDASQQQKQNDQQHRNIERSRVRPETPAAGDRRDPNHCGR